MDEDLHPEQIRAFRRMSPEDKIRLAGQHYLMARAWKAAGIRLQHPDWNEEQIQAEVRRVFLYAAT